MTTTPAFRRFAYTFAVSFALIYALARATGLALFTVYPSLGVIISGMRRSRDIVDPAMEFLAPEIWWYGWTASAALGALVFGIIAALVSEDWVRGLWPGWAWVAPLIAMTVSIYLTLPWFRQ